MSSHCCVSVVVMKRSDAIAPRSPIAAAARTSDEMVVRASLMNAHSSAPQGRTLIVCTPNYIQKWFRNALNAYWGTSVYSRNRALCVNI